MIKKFVERIFDFYVKYLYLITGVKIALYISFIVIVYLALNHII
jgi:hypothetical protein